MVGGLRNRSIDRIGLLAFFGAVAVLRGPYSRDINEARGAAFAATGRVASATLPGERMTDRGSRTTRSAYGAILRRDPFENEKLIDTIKQTSRVWKRARGLPEDEKAQAKKDAMLARLGLSSKIEAQKNAPPWDLQHVSVGDVFKGTFKHESIRGGSITDVFLSVTSETEGALKSDNGMLEADVKIMQDFPISPEIGSEARARDQAAYIFSKYNPKWRNFDEDVPSDEELQYLPLAGLRLFFRLVAKVDDFPSESDFNAACADPSKGMTLDEFLKFTVGEDPSYLENGWKEVYTGRRIQFGDDDIQFDGNFIQDCPGAIFGFVTVKGTPGGIFEMDLSLGK